MSYQDEDYDLYDQSEKIEGRIEKDHYSRKLEEANVPEEFWRYG